MWSTAPSNTQYQYSNCLGKLLIEHSQSNLSKGWILGAFVNDLLSIESFAVYYVTAVC